MNISLEIDQSLKSIEVIVRSPRIDGRTESIMATLRMHEKRVVGDSDGTSRVIPLGSILYAESVDGRTFAYTNDEVLRVRLSLAELESMAGGYGIVRASKSCLVNLCRVSSFRPYVGARLLANLENGESLVISRSYAKEVRRRLTTATPPQAERT